MRQSQLQALVDTFAAATTVLASERDGIERFLSSLVGLTGEGGRLLDLYGEQLPGDIANLTALMMILSRNSGAIENLLAGMPGIAEGIANAYQPEIDGIALRASGTPSLIALLDTIGEILGINPLEQP
jgi:ABC-type transporter Mla subunit MlaD